MLNDKIVDPLNVLNHQLHLSTKTPYFHLRAAQKLNFFQYHCIDVIVCFSIIWLLAMAVIVAVLRQCYRLIKMFMQCSVSSAKWTSCRNVPISIEEVEYAFLKRHVASSFRRIYLKLFNINIIIELWSLCPKLMMHLLLQITDIIHVYRIKFVRADNHHQRLCDTSEPENGFDEFLFQYFVWDIVKVR